MWRTKIKSHALGALIAHSHTDLLMIHYFHLLFRSVRPTQAAGRNTASYNGSPIIYRQRTAASAQIILIGA